MIEPRLPATPDEEIIWAEDAAVVALDTEAERLARIETELVMGFTVLGDLGPAVCVFGSARRPPGHPEYEHARRVGRLIGERGVAVITGGGPGLMEAANRGAREAGAYLRILVKLVQAALGRERHIVLRQAIEPFIPGSGREDRSQFAADALIAVDTAFAVGIALQKIRRLDDRGEAFPEFVRR